VSALRKYFLSAAAICLAVATSHCVADNRAEATGKVVDEGGSPLEHATVVVYKARVRNGYSVFCPTCWIDCGKRATTDAEGIFRVGGLDPELVFELLVVRDGYGATFVRDVDPTKGSTARAILKMRNSPPNSAQYVRGQVVNARGLAVPDAVVEPQAVTYNGEGGQPITEIGPRHWIDLIAVTNEKGEFEIAFDQPAHTMVLRVSPRGMAVKLFTLPTGAERKTLTVSDGATIHGRLVRAGKPVAHAEMGLSTHSRVAETALPEMRVGTRADGTFAMTNVPAGRIYYLYGKMGSLAERGVAELLECETKNDDEPVNVGDVLVKPAFTLRARVVLSDGKLIPRNVRAELFADRSGDSQSVIIGDDGAFEIKGLAQGVYDVAVSVKGYGLPPGGTTEVLVDRNPTNLLISLQAAASQ
jgi:hypothetical protein